MLIATESIVAMLFNRWHINFFLGCTLHIDTKRYPLLRISKIQDIYEGHSVLGDVMSPEVEYLSTTINLFTMYDLLGFLLSVTPCPPAGAHELDFYLPLLVPYAKRFSVLASHCGQKTQALTSSEEMRKICTAHSHFSFVF